MSIQFYKVHFNQDVHMIWPSRAERLKIVATTMRNMIHEQFLIRQKPGPGDFVFETDRSSSLCLNILNQLPKENGTLEPVPELGFFLPRLVLANTLALLNSNHNLQINLKISILARTFRLPS